MKRKTMRQASKMRLLLLLLLVAGGCTRTEVEEGEIPVHALKDVDAGFTLNVLASRPPVTRSILFSSFGTVDRDTLTVGVKDTLQTRATSPLANADENDIASLWVGQYDATTGNRLFCQYIASMTETTVNLKLKQSQNGSRSRVYFVANLGDLKDIADEKTLKGQVLTYSSTPEGLPSSNLCGMTGMWKGVVEEGGTKNLTVNLTRIVAKITFTYAIGGDDFSFTPTSVSLKSVPDKFQITAPTGQVAGVDYNTYYTGTANSKGATMYWYQPENMAGTVQGSDAVDAEKKKIGTGVENATCIELTGEAVQGGVTYGNVTFRFYPGSNANNYDIVRNTHYTMDVKLVGIDVFDERITVGEIPPIVVDGENMPAKKGGKKEVQITVRPGQKWIIDMPSWLSALLNEAEIKPGSRIEHQGPARLVFESVEANSEAEPREVSFEIDVNGDKQTIAITQDGSILTTSGDISLAASSGSEGSSSFTATEGVKWSTNLSGDGNWLSWSSAGQVTSGDEAPSEAQPLSVKATSSNPSAQARKEKITVKAGASVGNPDYTKLVKEIMVEQQGSTVTGSTVSDIAAKGASSEASFTATKGLDWAASVTSGDWISLTGGGSGNPTTGTSQTVTFDVAVNPTSSVRNGAIKVRVGDETNGPTGTITVQQKASELSASGDPTTLAATKDASGTLTFKGTAGLNFSATGPDWLTWTGSATGTTTGGSQSFGYKTCALNLNSTSKTGNISVKAGEMEQTVAVEQSGSVFSVSETELSFEKEGGSKTVIVNGTSGLPWTVSPSVATNGITPDITSSEADGTDQKLKFSATANAGGARSATFTIAVPDGDHSKTVEVKQASALSAISLTIDQSALASYRSITLSFSDYPPFDCDGTNRLPAGCTYNGEAMSGSYVIQVERGQNGATIKYANAQQYCRELDEDGTGWRIPTMVELYAIYRNIGVIEALPGVSKYLRDGYWSCSIFQSTLDKYCKFYFNVGSLGWNYRDMSPSYVRCVRDID